MSAINVLFCIGQTFRIRQNVIFYATFLKWQTCVLFHLQKEEIAFRMCPTPCVFVCACKFINIFLKTMKNLVRKDNICWYFEHNYHEETIIMVCFCSKCVCVCGGVANKTHPITLNKLFYISVVIVFFSSFTRLLSNVC